MRRFRFRLERFLELKRHKERDWELALARVLGQALLLRRRIAEIDGEVAGSYALRFIDGGLIDVLSMAGRELYVRRLAAEKERTAAELEIKNRELDEVRAKYLEAAKERKVLDKLKERTAAEYYEKQKDEEFRVIDDMNTAASSRAAMTGGGDRG
jgi:flagellar protein FliJ